MLHNRICSFLLRLETTTMAEPDSEAEFAATATVEAIATAAATA